MEIFYNALFDAVQDSLRCVPILFLAYLLVSWLSHDHNHKFYTFLSTHKKGSVPIAAFLGCLPQCGFSSVMADLYSKKKITIGTLIAVFVATSDESIPLMLAYPEKILSLILLIAIKIVLAIFWGYLIDLLFTVGRKKKQLADVETHEEHHAHNLAGHHHMHECGHIHSDECEDDCNHKNDCCVDNVFVDAMSHTLEILLYIFIATFLINLLVESLTVETITEFLSSNIYLQILLAGAVGLIPNCASSVLLVEMYLMGGLAFPAMIAGLTSGAGVGLVILMSKNRKHTLNTILIIIMQYVIGVVSGILLSLIPYLMTI